MTTAEALQSKISFGLITEKFREKRIAEA